MFKVYSKVKSDLERDERTHGYHPEKIDEIIHWRRMKDPRGIYID